MGAWCPQMKLHFGKPEKVRSCPHSSKSGPFPPLLLAALLTVARFALAGNSMRVEAAADGATPTARVPGVVPIAIAAINDFSGARRGRSREVRAARKKRRVCVREATCTAVARPHAAAVAAALPGPRARVAHNSPRPVCRVAAGRSAAAAP